MYVLLLPSLSVAVYTISYDPIVKTVVSTILTVISSVKSPSVKSSATNSKPSKSMSVPISIT